MVFVSISFMGLRPVITHNGYSMNFLMNKTYSLSGMFYNSALGLVRQLNLKPYVSRKMFALLSSVSVLGILESDN